MASFFSFLRSSILSKVVMAATGIILLLFLIGHMLGNMQMYLGPARMNAYAAMLQGLGGALWIVRAVLFLSVVLHVITSIRLKLSNMAAKPSAYVRKKWVKATLTSRTMFLTGSTIALFVTYHLLHFTFKATHPQYAGLRDTFGRMDVYAMVIAAYREPLISLVYIAAMVLLGFHLNHATLSALQTLGVNHPKYNGFIEKLSITVSLLIVLGFISIPCGVFLEIIKPVQATVAGGM
ncbi:MAG: succinate dehydrogenase cytochrome b subunit [Bacteroidota bacterium]|nr:succinate dehydrogenase cytochrome b subunit [Bacteroidota bacterium]